MNNNILNKSSQSNDSNKNILERDSSINGNNSNTLKDIEVSIVKKYAILVKRIAYHLITKLPPSIQEEDLCQAGMIGLLEASKNYDKTKGASFETFAGIRIRGAMLDEIRKIDWAPRSVHRNTRRVLQAMRNIENKTGRHAKDQEIAQELNITLEEYYQMLQETNCSKIIAFGDIGVNEDAMSFSPIEYNGGEPLERIENSDLKINLTREIAVLPSKERLVLALYYDEDLNLKEIGEVLGVSESRVSQIHSQAMIRLQSRLKNVLLI